MRSPSPRSPSPSPFTTQDALLHGQFTDWSTGGGSAGSSGGSSGADSGPSSPASGVSLPSSPSSSTYSLTLTPTHIHVQRVCPRPGKEAQLLLPLSELSGCNCPRAPAPPLFVLYWYPVGRRRRGVAKRRQMRAYLAETRAEAEKWNTAVQCLLRGIDISVYTGVCTCVCLIRHSICFTTLLYKTCSPFSRIQQKFVAAPTSPAAIGQSVQRAGVSDAVVSNTHFTNDQ